MLPGLEREVPEMLDLTEVSLSFRAMNTDVLARADLLMGAESGLNFIQSQLGVSGCLKLDDGRCLRSSGFLGVLNVA